MCYECAQSCPTLCGPLDYSPAVFSGNGIFPGKNTGVGSHALLQGIFPTQDRTCNSCIGFFTTEPPGKPQDCDITSDKLFPLHTNSFHRPSFLWVKHYKIEQERGVREDNLLF